MENTEDFTNPIDEKKVAENPGLLPFAHTIGSAIIRPVDKGRTKGIALRSMYEQSEMQLNRIKKQVELLLQEAQQIHERIKISEEIYQAEINFKPIPGHIYHVYRTPENKTVLSLIAPEEWRNCPYTFVHTVKLLSDHTWQIIR
jgi:hypothetical protein